MCKARGLFEFIILNKTQTMKKKRFKLFTFHSIKVKVSAIIGICTFFVIFILIGYMGYMTREKAINNVRKDAETIAVDYSTNIQSSLEQSLDATRIMVQSFESYQNIRQFDRRSVFMGVLSNILSSTPEYEAVYTFWEPYSIDNLDTLYADEELDNSGRFSVTYYRQNDRIRELDFTLEREQELAESQPYQKVKESKKEIILEPYYHSYTQAEEDRKLLTTLVVPVINSNKFVGMVAVDLRLENLSEMVDTLSIYNTGYGFILSNEATFIAHPNEEMVGESFSDLYPKLDNKFNITQKIKQGKAFTTIQPLGDNGEEFFITFEPINISNTTTWSFAVIIPKKSIVKDANKVLFYLILSGIIGMLLLFFVIYRVASQISSPLRNTTRVLERVAKGDIKETKELKTKTEDELNEMARSVNALVSGLRKTSEFANHIGKGNLEAEFTPLSDKDVLGNSLLEMRKSLQLSKEGEIQRKKEDERRNWTTQGITKFSDILRQSSENLKDLSFNVMSNLVDYLEINQGGLYVLNDEDKNNIYLELKAAIAYNRRKYHKQKVGLKEGLLGACALEKETIYVAELPENYITITSGLGTANPDNLLLVPLKIDEQVLGVIELASFSRFEKYQIELVEKIAENVASSIASVKINERTAKLLEQSRKQSEEMSAQEEEMRQNLEELQATQEEAARREAEMQATLKGLSDSFMIAYFDTEGFVLDANDRLLNKMELEKDQFIGQNHRNFANIDSKDEYPDGYDTFWNLLRGGQIVKKIYHSFSAKTNEEIWISETFAPILDASENIIKILYIGFDITESKKQEKEIFEQTGKIAKQEQEARANMEQLKKAQEKSAAQQAQMKSILNGLDESFLIVELDLDGKVTNINDLFLSTLGYTHDQIVGKNYKNFVHNIDEETEQDDFWDEIKAGRTVKEVQYIDTGSKEVWLSETYTPITNESGQLIQVMNVAIDVTENKLQEQEVKQLLAESEQKAEQLQMQEQVMRQSMEELASTKQELEERGKKLEEANRKMERNSEILKKALLKAKAKEKEAAEKQDETRIKETELKKNMEKLIAAQDELSKQKKELENANKKLQINESVLKKAYSKQKEKTQQMEKLKEEAAKKEVEYQKRIQHLEEELKKCKGN